MGEPWVTLGQIAEHVDHGRPPALPMRLHREDHLVAVAEHLAEQSAEHPVALAAMQEEDRSESFGQGPLSRPASPLDRRRRHLSYRLFAPWIQSPLLPLGVGQRCNPEPLTERSRNHGVTLQ